MRKLIVIISLILTSSSIAQLDSISIRRDINDLHKVISAQEIKIDSLNYQTEIIKESNNELINSQISLEKKYNQLLNLFNKYKESSGVSIDSLRKNVQLNSAYIENKTNELGGKIENSEKSVKKDINELDQSLSQKTLYWIIGILLVALLVLLVYIFLRKQLFKQKDDLANSLHETRKELEEEGLKLDNKLIEVLESQLKIFSATDKDDNIEIDHSLALKVADEVVRIEKNISKMDSDTKGIKPLVKGVERIKDNFKANGYEMVQLLEKEYDDGMNIDVINFIDDDTIPSGKKIITRIIKPQVNYNDVLIQRAQVDISQN